jgi:hypothetical protein
MKADRTVAEVELGLEEREMLPWMLRRYVKNPSMR